MEDSPPLDVAVSRLVEILTLERSRLLAGAYDTLAEITEYKSRYLSALAHYLETEEYGPSLRAHAAHIEQIKKLAVENERLLNAAKAGVQSAQSSLKKIMNRDSYVGAYAENGEKLLAPDAGVTRRKFA